MLAGSVSVLIGGVPAARASDVGLAPLCFGFAPAFDIWTGSSNTWIGGSRAARMMDITRHCNPASAMGAIGKAMGAIGVVAGAVSAGASAAGGDALRASMQAAQAAADAAALAMSALLGKDPGIPPSMGAIMMGNPTVLIGGFPMPDVLELLGGLVKGLKMLGKAVGKSKAFGKILSKVGLCNAPGEPVNPYTGEVFNDFEDYQAARHQVLLGAALPERLEPGRRPLRVRLPSRLSTDLDAASQARDLRDARRRGGGPREAGGRQLRPHGWFQSLGRRPAARAPDGPRGDAALRGGT